MFPSSYNILAISKPYRTCPYEKFGFENVWLNVNYMGVGHFKTSIIIEKQSDIRLHQTYMVISRNTDYNPLEVLQNFIVMIQLYYCTPTEIIGIC